MGESNWQFLLGSGIIGSILTMIVNKFLNRKHDAIQAITDIINIQTDNIKRQEDNIRKQEEKIDILNQRIDKLEKELSIKNRITRSYTRCEIPNERCPVYITAKEHGEI